MALPFHISAKDGTDFYRQAAAFAYSAFLAHGIGTILIREGQFHTLKNGAVEADVDYLPYDISETLMPSEIAELVNAYDHKTECVVTIVDAQEKATCVLLQAAQLGETPEETYLKQIKAAGKIAFAKGTVLELRGPVVDVPVGYYVFMGQVGGHILLSPAGLDEDEGDFVEAGEPVKVHLDFAELFRDTGINIHDQPVD